MCFSPYIYFHKGISAILLAMLVKSSHHPLRRLLLVLAGAVIMAFNINTFVRAGSLIPGGFTGLTLLIKEVFLRYNGVHIPFSLVLYTLNSVPAIFCFKFIGKRFTLYSCLSVLVCGLLTDWLPVFSFTSMLIDAIQLHDILLSSVLGGILNAAAITLCLHADATSGGTDFIAVYISEKYRKDAWTSIFAGNCVLLVIAAYFLSLDSALHSIVFQFVTTMAISALYKNYQQKTMLIITAKPDAVSTLIWEKTHHGATSFEGTGSYQKNRRILLYSVVSTNETAPLINAIRAIDDDAFINVIKTDLLNGRFYQRPKD